MQEFLTLRNGRKIRLNTSQEDAEITHAALADPDAQPLTDEQLAEKYLQMKIRLAQRGIVVAE